MQLQTSSGWPVTRRVITKRASVQLTDIQKLVGSGKRRVRGMASSIRPDRQGDIVEPKGGTWKLPVPLLWQHSHKDPVGWVRSIDVHSDGLWIEAEFAEGFDRADEVWRMIQAGLLDSFSIGFRSMKSEPLSGGGLRFTRWELLEISVVVVPANADAKISRSGARRAEIPGHSGAVRINATPKGCVRIRSKYPPLPKGCVRIIGMPEGSVRLINAKVAQMKAESRVPGHPGAIRLTRRGR